MEQELKEFSGINIDTYELKEKEDLYGNDPQLVRKAFKEIERLWNDELTSRKFVKHLMSAFLPINPFNKVMKTGKFDILRCAINGTRLVGLMNIAEEWSKISTENIFLQANIYLNEEGGKEKIEEAKAKIEEAKSKMSEAVRTGSYAMMSESSSKVLSREAIAALSLFTEAMILRGNKDVQGIFYKMRKLEQGSQEKPIIHQKSNEELAKENEEYERKREQKLDEAKKKEFAERTPAKNYGIADILSPEALEKLSKLKGE